jgi:hypothetical protein
MIVGTARAEGTPAELCAGAKLKAVGKSAKVRLVCHAKAARKGGNVAPDCLATTET